jgi:hypothetical protein
MHNRKIAEIFAPVTKHIVLHPLIASRKVLNKNKYEKPYELRRGVRPSRIYCFTRIAKAKALLHHFCLESHLT